MERKAWHCPGCGKVHAPHVDTCPEAAAVSVPSCWPARDTTGQQLKPHPMDGLRTGDPVPWMPSSILLGAEQTTWVNLPRN